ncbi:MAG TPA: P-II family nitrogen regulator [Candidatus Acidoferrales bacterium]
MKEIKAIIQPFMLSKVVNALKDLKSLPGVTVDTSVRGFGKGRAADAPARIVEDLVEYVPKVKLEIVVPDGLVETVVAVIQKNAHTGNAGDGKIFVYNVEEVIKIRTGERGEGAI